MQKFLHHFKMSMHQPPAKRQAIGKQPRAGFTGNKWAAIGFLLLITSILSSVSAVAQISTYTFSTSTTGSLVDMSSGTTDLLTTGTYKDDVASTVRNIGFDFDFAGTTYTQFSVNSNGQMRLGSTIISGGSIISGSSGAAILAPISGDNALLASGKAHFKVIGTAPNRTLAVEWTGLRIPLGSTGTGSVIQVLISETTGVIEYRYGTMHNNSTSATSRSVAISSGNTVGQNGIVTTIPTTPTFTATSASTFTTSSFVASSPMMNLSSTADGSRRTFTFTPPACAVPSGLSASNLTSSSAILNWNAVPSATSGYLIRYKATSDATSVSTWATPTAVSSGTSLSLSGLSPSTQYEFQVQSDCGSSTVSAFSASTTFTTLCNPVTSLPYTDGFETAITPALPSCWARSNDNGDGVTWITSTTAPRTGTKHASIQWNATLAMNDWLYSPGIQLTGGQSYDVSFWYRAANATYTEKLEVKWGTSPSAAGMTNATSFNNTGFNSLTYAEGKTTFTPTTSGVYYIGWHGYSIADQHSIFIDDITIKETPVDDASVTALTAPTSPFTPGLNTISATVLNLGAADMTSVTLTYTLNGGTPVTQTFSGFTLTTGQSTTLSFTTQANFVNGANAVVVTSTMPNGNTDSNTSNDSFTVTLFPALCGNYNIGTGGDFATLDAAVTALNGGGATCAVTFLFTDATYPATAGITINQYAGNNSTNSLTIKPANGISPVLTTTSGATFAIRLNGVSHVTLDGSNNGSTSQNWSLTTTAGSSASLVQLGSNTAGAAPTNNMIKNLVLTGAPSATTFTTGFGIRSAVASPATTGASNNTFQNNAITQVQTGISVVGLSNAVRDVNTIITGNQIGSGTTGAGFGGATALGITASNQNSITITGNTIQNPVIVASGANPAGATALISVATLIGIDLSSNITTATVSNNTVRNLLTSGSSGATSPLAGIRLNTAVTGATVNANFITNIKTTNTFGYGGYGIYVNTGTANTATIISNNMVSDINGSNFSGFSNSSSAGIYLNSTQSGISIVYNSINMFGNYTRASIANTAALAVESGSTGLTVRNNILANSMVGSTAGSLPFSMFSGAPASAYTVINNNNYHSSGSQATNPVIFRMGGTNGTTLAALRTATGQDAASVSVAPPFISDTDLHINNTHPNASALNGAAAPLSVTTDFDGATRDATKPDIGADEFTLPLQDVGISAIVQPAASNCYGGSQPLEVTITNFDAAATIHTIPVSVLITKPGGATETIDSTFTGTIAANGTVNFVVGNYMVTGSGTYSFEATTVYSNDPIATNNAFTQAITVTVPDAITVTATPGNTVCAGETITLAASSGTAYTYTWTSTTGGGLVSTSGASVTATPTQTTTYTVTGVSGSCTITQDITITVNPAPLVTLTTSPSAICAGSTSQIIATNPAAYTNLKITEVTLFRTGTGATPTYPSTVGTGDDLLEISNVGSTPLNIGGLVFEMYTGTTLNRTYTFPAGTTLPATSVLVLHLGTGTDNAANRFFNTGGTTNSLFTADPVGFILRGSSGGAIIEAVALNNYAFPAISGVTAADFSGSASSPSGAAGTIRTSGIDTNTGADFTPATAAAPQSIGTFNSSANYAATAGTFTYSYSVSPAGGTLSSATDQNPTFTSNTPGSYTITLTTTNTATNCTSTSTANITVNQIPTAVVTSAPAAVNPGQSSTVSIAMTGNAPFTFTYTDGTIPVTVTGTSTNPYTFSTGALSASATYTVTALNDANCTAADLTAATTTVTVLGTPVDVAPIRLVSPANVAACISGPQTVTVRIQNKGTQPLDFTTDPVTVTVNVTGSATQSFSAIVNSGSALAINDSLDVNLTPTLTMAPGSNYSFAIVATAPNDGNTGNDTHTETRTTPQAPDAPTVTPATATVCTGNSQLLTASNPFSSASIGTGTSTTTTTAKTESPYGRYYEGGRVQYLITASELAAAGITGNVSLDQLKFNVATIPSNAAAYQNFSIKLANTAVTALTTTFQTGLTTVLNPSNYTPVVGMNTHTFDVPFAYTGGNLLVDVSFVGDANCLSGSCYDNNSTVRTSTTSFVSVSRYHVDNNTAANTNATADATSSVRPNMIFTASASVSYQYSLVSGDGLPATTNTGTITVNPTVTSVYSVTATNLSTGCTSPATPITITVNDLPTVALSNNGPVCHNTTATITGNLTGTAPFSITYTTNGGNPQTMTSSSNQFTITTAALTANTTYEVTALSDANCAATTFPAAASTTVTVRPEPTVALSNSGPVCSNSTGTVTGNATGTAPFSITYTTNGANPQTITATSSQFTIPTGQLTANTTFEVTALSDAHCAATTFSVATTTTMVVTEVTTYTGTATGDGNNWFNPANWTACVPSANIDAIIPAGLANYPILNAPAIAEVRTLTIDNGAAMVQNGGTLQLFGHFTNNASTASVNLAGGTVAFLGSLTQNINGLGSLSFFNLTVNKPNEDLMLGNNPTVRNALVMSRGLLRTVSSTVILGATATISESDDSYLLGTVETTRNLNTRTTHTFGGMGFEIALASNSGLPGVTLLRRVTGQHFAIGTLAATIARYFQVQANNDNVRADILFRYLTPELAQQNEAVLKLYSSVNQGASWTVRANSLSDINTNSIDSRNPQVTSINMWWSASDGITPLPVELVSFTAVKRENNALLNWSTASEKDSKGFEVEVSTNGREFRKIGFVESRNGNTLQKYTFTDSETGKTGTRYYRLKQVDLNGDFAYSVVRSLTFGKQQLLVDVYPNPFNSEVNLAIQALAAETGTITITDLAGKTVLLKQVKVETGANKLKLQPAQHLPAGAYLITVDLGGERFTTKLLKQY